MSGNKNKRRFRQLQKHEAGYALIAIALVLFVMALMIGEYRFTIIGGILAVTGIVFQFGKGPPDNPYYGESGQR
ncbi:MAG: hypothetical protein JJT75_01995 [Opitutales bacterium]|nr:hypothetical protein [Opitutales bacterium]MCH8541142.1 hypothetical protein [Opitutales bacterium]